MGRYLMFFSYIGTSFKGMQRQTYGKEKLDIGTVQGALEKALHRLRPKNEVKICTSSRTDKGVHAFCNSAHVHLEHWKEEKSYDAQDVTNSLNHYLSKEGHDICIVKTIPVSSNFHARFHALGRSYLYRLAVLKNSTLNDVIFSSVELRSALPIVEFERCHIIGPRFDEEKFRKSASLLSGTHDYATYMCAKKLNSDDPPLVTRRTLEINVNPGCGLLSNYDPLYEHLCFYDITCTSRSFLYKQIRKLVGAMISCAQGRTNLEEIRFMLENPSLTNWLSKITLAPACGLYLQHVTYNEEDFENPRLLTPASTLQDDETVNNVSLEESDDEIEFPQRVSPKIE